MCNLAFLICVEMCRVCHSALKLLKIVLHSGKSRPPPWPLLQIHHHFSLHVKMVIAFLRVWVVRVHRLHLLCKKISYTQEVNAKRHTGTLHGSKPAPFCVNRKQHQVSNSLITHLFILVGHNKLFISGFSFLGCQDSNKIMASNLCLLGKTKLVNTRIIS